jgi:hypothetical protein
MVRYLSLAGFRRVQDCVLEEKRIWRLRRFVTIFYNLFCNRWSQIMYLYHVLVVTMNICGTDCQKKPEDQHWNTMPHKKGKRPNGPLCPRSPLRSSIDSSLRRTKRPFLQRIRSMLCGKRRDVKGKLVFYLKVYQHWIIYPKLIGHWQIPIRDVKAKINKYMKPLVKDDH